MFTELFAWASFGFGLFILGMNAGVVAYYRIHSTRYFAHITMMAVSFSLLTVTSVLTVNYRIFYEGVSRFLGCVVLLTAYLSGIVGLFLIFKRRAGNTIHRTEQPDSE